MRMWKQMQTLKRAQGSNGKLAGLFLLLLVGVVLADENALSFPREAQAKRTSQVSNPNRPVHEIAFYVAPDGDDRWSGMHPSPNRQRTDGPFATLHRAVEAIRELKRQHGGVLKQPITVYLREGTYFLREPIVLTPEDSGREGCPITFTAYRKERPVISGGRRITGWQKRGDLWVAHIPDVQAGRWYFRILRVGDDWGIRARHPNYDPEHPFTGGWLFAQWWGKPWEQGAFNMGVSRIEHPGDRLEWKIVVPQSGEYRVWIHYARPAIPEAKTMDAHMTLRVDGSEPVFLRHLSDTESWIHFRWVQTATLYLPAGEQTLIWENTHGGGIHLDAFCLTDDPDWNPEKAIQILGWWGEFQIDPPKPEKHLLVVQAEACTQAVGKEVRIAPNAQPGSRKQITLAPDKFPEFKDWHGAEVHVFPAWGWVNAIVKVDGVDQAHHRLYVECAQDIRPGNRLFIANLREALDAPNEWYLDPKTGELLYKPTHPAFPNREVVAPAMDRLIVLQGDAQANRFVEHLHFRGLTFTDTDYTVPGGYYTPDDSAVWMSATRRCVIERCTFSRLGGYAVRLEHRSHENAIVHNRMAYLGQGGVLLFGETATQPYDNLIAGNTLSDCGLIYKHVGGVYVASGSGNRIAHNRIMRVPRYGISLKSLNEKFYSHKNIVEFNELIDTNLETNDTGAIETLGRDQGDSGNIIRFNYIRNVVGMGTTPEGEIQTPYFTWGIYLDDYSSGTLIYGNIVIGTVLGAVCIHGGKDNLVENNIFVEGAERQITLHPRDAFMQGNIFRRNIIVLREPHSAVWYTPVRSWPQQSLKESDYNLYWSLAGKERTLSGDKITPLGDWQAWQDAGYDRHSIVADPEFVAFEKGDFRLKPSSPAFKLGFKPIPIEQIGPKGFRTEANAEAYIK